MFSYHLACAVLLWTFYSGHTCIISYTNTNIEVNCVAAHLTKVPANIPNASNVTSLDLSRNHITELEADAFQRFPQLEKLNLSSSGVNKIHENALRDLINLTTLDLSFNPVIAYDNLPIGLFEHVPTVTHLNITGKPVAGKLFLPLVNLAELIMTASSNTIPYELVQLKKLRVLTFARGQISNLTKNILQPFANSDIEELALVNSGITEIEHGTFDHFASLRVLNLACNYRANVNGILENLSGTSNLQVDTLILDLVGVDLHLPVVVGWSRNGSCPKVWRSLKKLSARGINLFDVHDIKCLRSIKMVSFGFNSPIIGTIYDDSFGVEYLDISFLFVHDIYSARQRCRDAWVPSNGDFFPAERPEWRPSSSSSKPLFETASHQDVPESCGKVIIPVNLTYFKSDHLAHKLWQNRKCCAILMTIMCDT